MAPKKNNRAAAARAIAQSFVLSPAAVHVPTAPMVSERFPFIASQLKKVCRSSKVAPTCYGKGGVKLTAKKLSLNRPTEAEYVKACKRAGGKMEKGYNKAIRAGKVELDFLSPAQAKLLGTMPGPNLRLCLRDNDKGYIVPVSDPSDAQRMQREFAKCTGTDKKKMPACALKVATASLPKGQKARLGGGLNTGGLLGGLFTRGGR